MKATLTRNETEVLALLKGANGPMTAYQLLGLGRETPLTGHHRRG